MLDALAEHLRARLADVGLTERVGPFLVAIDPHSARPFANYAVPDTGADPSAAEVARLGERFAAHGRDARVEYFPALAPRLAATLAAAGFAPERCSPVMAADAGSLRPAAAPDGVAVCPVDPARDADVADALAAAHVSFAEPGPPDEADRRRLRRSLGRGGGAVLARRDPGGAALGVAQHTAVAVGASEVVGVGVLPAARRRGLGSALSASVSARALAAGARWVWLVPEGPGAEALYRAVGYRVVGEVRHLGRPA
jgi:ribosomal protein S18 acetylase RimI-like enzyme